MFYIKATFAGITRYIGKAPDLDTAHYYGDNAGFLFSEGSPPDTVVIEIHNTDESVKVVTEYYNGFCRQLEAIGI